MGSGGKTILIAQCRAGGQLRGNGLKHPAPGPHIDTPDGIDAPPQLHEIGTPAVDVLERAGLVGLVRDGRARLGRLGRPLRERKPVPRVVDLHEPPTFPVPGRHTRAEPQPPPPKPGPPLRRPCRRLRTRPCRARTAEFPRRQPRQRSPHRPHATTSPYATSATSATTRTPPPTAATSRLAPLRTITRPRRV